MTDEQVPDPLANLDQLIRGLADIAKVISAFVKEMEDAGFSRDEAIRFGLAFQHDLHSKAS